MLPSVSAYAKFWEGAYQSRNASRNSSQLRAPISISTPWNWCARSSTTLRNDSVRASPFIAGLITGPWWVTSTSSTTGLARPRTLISSRTSSPSRQSSPKAYCDGLSGFTLSTNRSSPYLRRRQPPGDVVVVADDDVGCGGEAGARHLELRRVQVALPEDRRHLEGEGRVVRQQRLAGRGLLAVDGPVVAEAAAGQGAHQLRGRGVVFVQGRAGAFRLRARRDDQRHPLRVRRLELVRHLSAEPLNRPRAEYLRVPVPR